MRILKLLAKWKRLMDGRSLARINPVAAHWQLWRKQFSTLSPVWRRWL